MRRPTAPLSSDRHAEWEQRAIENKAALEGAQLAREQAEDRAAQLEEHSSVQMQPDEKSLLVKLHLH